MSRIRGIIAFQTKKLNLKRDLRIKWQNVDHNMLHAFGHPVATCWVLKNELVCTPERIVAQTWPKEYNIMQRPTNVA